MIHSKRIIPTLHHTRLYRPDEVTKHYSDSEILFVCENNLIPLQEFMEYVRLCELQPKNFIGFRDIIFFIVV